MTFPPLLHIVSLYHSPRSIEEGRTGQVTEGRIHRLTSLIPFHEWTYISNALPQWNVLLKMSFHYYLLEMNLKSKFIASTFYTCLIDIVAMRGWENLLLLGDNEWTKAAKVAVTKEFDLCVFLTVCAIWSGTIGINFKFFVRGCSFSLLHIIHLTCTWCSLEYRLNLILNLIISVVSWPIWHDCTGTMEWSFTRQKITI